MEQLEKSVKHHIENEYSDYSITTTFPQWLRKERWKPSLLLKSEDKKRILAIDIILSGTIPHFQYTTIVKTLLQKHKNLRVIIVTLEESYEINPEIKSFCTTFNLGLKIFIPEMGLQTIARIDLDPEAVKSNLPVEKGWFPASILNKVKGLNKLRFHDIIDNFVDEVQNCGDNEQETFILVHRTIDELLRCHPSFVGNFGQFMKLAHFEKLLRITDPKSSDHVFHSFRVFLAGCPVINEFYDLFVNAQKSLTIMDSGGLIIEYIWFLTAIFHDIGRPKESAIQLFNNTFDDEDLEISININDARWKRDHNINAKQVLGSLGAFVIDENENAQWDGGSILGRDAKDIATKCINIYGSMKSHSLISAFDFLGDLLKKAVAADEKEHWPFIVTHAAPAALSIMLHDWKIWEDMREMALIPVYVPLLPMAALLIYIDTWDNYKRKGPDPLIFIKRYLINPSGAHVEIEWEDSTLMKNDAVGYGEYKKAFKNELFEMEIKYGMAGTL